MEIKRDAMISEFCRGIKKILENALYGIVCYGDPKGKDIDVCIVYHQNKNPKKEELKRLKKQIEVKYGIEVDVLCFPPDVFSEALSRMTSNIGIIKILNQLTVYYRNSNFYDLVLESINNPIDKPPLKIDEYKL